MNDGAHDAKTCENGVQDEADKTRWSAFRHAVSDVMQVICSSLLSRHSLAKLCSKIAFLDFHELVAYAC